MNVIRGEMTIVGPRPETPDYVRWLADEIPFYKPRHFTKPGITGWAQVCAGYASSIEDTRTKLSYDLYYIRNRSFSLDLAIILRTFATVAERLRGEMTPAGRVGPGICSKEHIDMTRYWYCPQGCGRCQKSTEGRPSGRPFCVLKEVSWSSSTSPRSPSR